MMSGFQFSVLCIIFSIYIISVNYCAKIPSGSDDSITTTSTTTESNQIKSKSIHLSEGKLKGSIINSTTTISPIPTSTEPILPEWGGNCTKKHWDKCSHLKTWVTSHYVNVKKKELGFKYHETDCTIQPSICLKNGWTVTRCQLLCMRCNREILSKYEKYVAKDGTC